NAIKRCDLLAQYRAVWLCVGPGFGLLALMIAAHTLRSGFERGALRSIELIQRSLQCPAGNFEIGYAGGLHPVKALGVLQYRLIASLLHIAQDFGDSAFYGFVLRGV